MRYLVKVCDGAGARSYHAIGNRDALMDAAYDAGALGVTVVPA